jgi:hypothetical protein
VLFSHIISYHVTQYRIMRCHDSPLGCSGVSSFAPQEGPEVVSLLALSKVLHSAPTLQRAGEEKRRGAEEGRSDVKNVHRRRGKMNRDGRRWADHTQQAGQDRTGQVGTGQECCYSAQGSRNGQASTPMISTHRCCCSQQLGF